MTKSDIRPDLILTNAKVLTMNPSQPVAQWVAIQGDRIVWVGDHTGLASLRSPSSKIIDCQGKTLIPGFVDAHCHFLAYASSLLHVDCGPENVSSISDIKRIIRKRAQHTPQGEWIRASGYSEFDLLEKRHPTRNDLDEVAPNHPVRLDHRSRHATALNSLALNRVGISASSEEHESGFIDRDPASGEPTGLLLEYRGYLSKFIPPLARQQLEDALSKANQKLLGYGVTSIQDASPFNDLKRWNEFANFKTNRLIESRITMMIGGSKVNGFKEAGLSFGSGNHDVNLGHAKLMVTFADGTTTPSVEAIQEAISEAYRAGFPVAIHAVEAEAAIASLNALSVASKSGPTNLLDRIEHLSECSPQVLELLKKRQPAIATQPGFIYSSGSRYLSEVNQEKHPWLYRIGALRKAGLLVAGSSDAPVAEPNPFPGMYSAITRRASTGEVVNEAEGISMNDALAMYTVNGAKVSSQEQDKGTIEIGRFADLVLLKDDLDNNEPERLLKNRAILTIVGGKVVYER